MSIWHSIFSRNGSDGGDITIGHICRCHQGLDPVQQFLGRIYVPIKWHSPMLIIVLYHHLALKPIVGPQGRHERRPRINHCTTSCEGNGDCEGEGSNVERGMNSGALALSLLLIEVRLS
ncbi:hypothetical protein Adt_13219 [Abeliophyllum distichum]|uniref:Uncharacterized protein n=1 Tax=Abeliophyllum distichum TaxID=126358 RepID=A0ABD1TW68_9LAMI